MELHRTLAELESRLKELDAELLTASPRQKVTLSAARDRTMAAICQVHDAMASKALATSITDAVASMRTATDDAPFWFRRFYTSLLIGNGGLLSVIGGASVQAPESLRKTIGPEIALPVIMLAVGLICAALLPLVLAWQRENLVKAAKPGAQTDVKFYNWPIMALAGFSALLFMAALGIIVIQGVATWLVSAGS